MMNKFLKSNANYLYIVIFSVVCYYFLWLNPYSMKWDLAEQYLPWRYFIGKCIQNGELPFWNPFQLGGYPTYADPQSGTLYYPVWIIGSAFGYSMRVIQLEILAFIIIGGIGLYQLSNKLGNSKISSLIISLSYASCGFFVGNAQHLTWIAAAAWIPILMSQYYSIRLNIFKINLIWFLLILYLFVSSAYPAFVITCFYIIFIDQIYLFIKSSNKIKFAFHRFAFTAFAIIILFPIIYSVYSSINYFSRGDGISIEKALQHPFSFQSLISLIAPFSSFKNPEYFNTDISMSNAYMGLFPIMLFSIYIISKKNRKSSFWIIVSLVFLIISVGSQTPIREILYKFLPGFDLFRFPSLFRLFFIISFLLFCASYYESLKVYFETHRRKVLFILLSFVLFFVIVILIYADVWRGVPLDSISKLFTFNESSTFKQNLIYQLFIQSILLLVTIILFSFRQRKFIIWLICFDLIISVRLNSTATIILNTKTKDVDALIKNADKHFHTPKLQVLTKSIDQQYEYRWPLNWNMNCYFGEIAIDGYNPFILKTFNELSDSKFRDSIWKNEWYYFPKQVLISDTPNTLESNTAWIFKKQYHQLNNYSSDVIIDKISFGPNEISFEYEARTSTPFVLAQNPYENWTAKVDGENLNIELVNISQQMIMLKPGKHTLVWAFNNILLNWIMLIHFIIFMLLLLFGSIKTYQEYIKTNNSNL